MLFDDNSELISPGEVDEALEIYYQVYKLSLTQKTLLRRGIVVMRSRKRQVLTISSIVAIILITIAFALVTQTPVEIGVPLIVGGVLIGTLLILRVCNIL